MVETITATASPALDHIIERPRLIARLAEGGGARVSVLAAQAGYGKTTLARQWSQRQSGPVSWYRTTRASGDVALLAVQLDDLLASIAPELPREPEKVATIASVNPSPQPLGRAILRTFESLPREVLLVVDEWEAAGTDEAEELLSMLVEGLDIRFLITTRTRPDWFTPRLEVYGEGLEIGVDELTMTDKEAAQVLNAVGAVAGRARLMRNAEGWPAVLGLAAMSGDVDFTSSRLLSHTLYDFLAGELLASAAEGTQTALMLLAVASITDIEVARSVLGAGADEVMEDAVACGLLAITERKSLSLHPLLRELLIGRFRHADSPTREAQLQRARRLFDLRRWDEALSVAEVASDAAFAAEALEAALDDLLAAGRTSSLQRWVAAARSSGSEGGLIDYAESEARLRSNELDRASVLATQAARSLEGDLAARAHLVAGTSAHLTDRPNRTDLHAELAATFAETPDTREGALWLRFLSAAVRQAADLTGCLEDFRTAARSGLKQSLMITTAELVVSELEAGKKDALRDARAVLEVAKREADPIAHTGLLSVYTSELVRNGRYEESLKSSKTLACAAKNFGLEFATPYAQCYSASALIGLRRFAAAARMLSALERDTQDDPGSYFRCCLPVQRARLYASVGDLRRAQEVLSLGPPENLNSAPHGEFIGWRALFAAIANDEREAHALAKDARRVSRDLGTRALSEITEALIALNDEQSGAAVARVQAAIDTRSWDAVVVAARAAPGLAAFIAEQTQWRSWFQQLLAASRDASLAASLGMRIPRVARTKASLSPRESEVHELIAQGLTNEEIGKVLYISLSTTKVHVKHIYEKLGVRSRLEAARALRDDI
ncbi:MAG TPA: LuxR C-terminal-related transcriptional regulator [Gaiellaceae bacterium]|nr:LuxR C-terminal-related transcriptional regulator [Gaiellaceae bacterium]